MPGQPRRGELSPGGEPAEEESGSGDAGQAVGGEVAGRRAVRHRQRQDLALLLGRPPHLTPAGHPLIVDVLLLDRRLPLLPPPPDGIGPEPPEGEEAEFPPVETELTDE